MKKLNRLQIKPERRLDEKELIRIKGGDEWAYLCRCGFTPDYYGDCFPVVRDTLEEALQYAGSTCNGHGATCNGWSLGCPD